MQKKNRGKTGVLPFSISYYLTGRTPVDQQPYALNLNYLTSTFFVFSPNLMMYTPDGTLEPL